MLWHWQAMMELGATVCTGNAAPSCTACPIRARCLAHQRYAASGGAAPPVTSYPAKVLLYDDEPSLHIKEPSICSMPNAMHCAE